ncbi:cation transporter [Gleimia sp. 6138-11-ORH1]|uniref:heavy-metal-associated domain-containing protein n=1 Tax=Gleimia sp. 6138-11-ORH1 TaxID=2973937 RepID=UPI0021697357|nr:cation transporter [Gleimia sp. 6138-11-ORH1]MCS4485035.1 cation transporter [Gleimia sp. 6138-11-ORH1]
MSTYKIEVKGLTCGHCVASVTEELQEIPEVSAVEVALNAGKEAVSVASVTTSAEVSEAAFANAVDEAGYELVSVSAD